MNNSNQYFFSRYYNVPFLFIFLSTFLLSGCCLYSVFPSGDYHCSQVDFEDLVKSRHYQEAFDQLEKDSLIDSTYTNKVQYDILNVFLHGRTIKKNELLIYSSYLEYPNSNNWTMLSAKALIVYLDTGHINPKILQDLQTDFTYFSQDKAYWFDVIKHLNNPRPN
ncbi:hypothetical protein [Sulfurimonas sp.]|uniref:hypothetical protein n=1 Tax=Sulfurimonas sp. TaxID=2022749 RepID=UPI003D1299FA